MRSVKILSKDKSSQSVDNLKQRARATHDHEPQITIQAAPRGVLLTASLVVVIWGAAQARPLLIPLCIAALLAFLIAPAVRLLKRIHFPEWAAIVAAAIILLLPFSALGYLLYNQGQALVRDFPKIVVSFDRYRISFLSSLAENPFGKKLHLEKYISSSSIADQIASKAGQGLQVVVSGLGALLDAGSQTALVLLFTILMLASRKQLRNSVEKLVNPKVLDESSGLIEKFLLARFVIMAIIGAIDTGILVAFNLSYPILLGAILGVMTIVPAIGFIIALIPPILVSLAMSHSLIATLGMVGCLFVMSIVEGNILTPKLAGRSININALATFVGLFAGGLLWGIWGMLLSIPLLGVLRVALSSVPSLQPWGDLLSGEVTPSFDNDPNRTVITAPNVRQNKRFFHPGQKL